MTIIFCFTRIFRNSHRRIFSLDTLVERGYNVILLDLGRFFGREISSCDDEFMLKLRTRLSNPAEVENFVKQLGEKPVIYVSNDVYLTSETEVFKLLIRKQDRLLAFKTKIIPYQHQVYTGSKLLIENFLTSLSHLPLSFLRPIYLKSHRYCAPDYFLCSTEYNLPLKARLVVKKKNIFIVHSDDVNRIIEQEDISYDGERVGVFLDQVLPLAYHGKVPDSYFDEYYEKISTTLLQYKKKLNLDRIIIAEHPEAGFHQARLKDKYNHFDRFRGETHRLIKNATFVFGHFSTSIGFAAYFKKPVVLLVDDQLLAIKRIASCVKMYADHLKVPYVNIDNVKSPSDLPDSTVDVEAYKKYVERFMKDSDIQDDSYLYSLRKIEQDLKNS